MGTILDAPAKTVEVEVVVEDGDADVVTQVRDLAGGHGVDVVLEGVGKPGVWPIIAGIIAPWGRIMMTGLSAGQSYGVLFDPLVVNDVTINMILQP